jgi:hypothetical protein
MPMSTAVKALAGGILAPALVAVGLVINPGESDSTQADGHPHVDHVTLPLHKTWQVVSVAPYEGLEEVELVKFDWPTPQDPRSAFALTKEGLTVGDQICLDHVREIDTYWAHPVPEGGCEARAQNGGARK